MDNSLYLTDEQYLDILDKIENKLNSNVKVRIDDCTTIGNKSTESNIGFCNEEFTILETALFPDDFIKYGRKSRKYRLNNHACPFDNRIRNPYEKHGLMNLGEGCYYTCCLNKKNYPMKS